MIRLSDISKYYKGNQTISMGLHKINLEFEKGDFVAITGESGSGKSTLLNVISGTDTYEEGELYFCGEETSYYDAADWEKYRKEQIGFIYQNYRLIDSFTVLDNVLAAMWIVDPFLDEKEGGERALAYLKKVGLEKQAKKRASHLSSGQKQRLSIARALAKDTPILVADEPTGNLDEENSWQIIEILQELSKEKLVLIVTHNYDEVEPYVTRKIRMFDGEVEEDLRLRPNHLDGKNPDGKNSEGEKIPPKEKSDVKKTGEHKKPEPVLAGKILRKERKAKPHSQLVILLLFVFIFAAIYVFVGSFDKSIDYSTARDYSDNTFANGDKTRISVRKSDGRAMTKEDLKKLKKVSHVAYADFYDVICDISYMDSEGEDYKYDMRNNSGRETTLPEKKSVEALDKSKMLRSATELSDGDIKKGKMPQNLYEIAVNSTDSKLVGTSMEAQLLRSYNWENSNAAVTFTVTGITSCGEQGQIFVSEKTAKMLNVISKKASNVIFRGIYTTRGKGVDVSSAHTLSEEEMEAMSKQQGEEIVAPIFLINEELKDNEAILSDDYYSDAFVTSSMGSSTVYYLMKVSPDAVLTFKENAQITMQQLHLVKGAPDHGNKVIEVGSDCFDELYPDQASYQISVFTEDYAYTDRTVRAINRLGYEAVSVFRAGSIGYNDELVASQTTMMLISLGALAAVFVAGVFLIRMMLGARKRDHETFRMLGMSRRTVDEMNKREILYDGGAALVITWILTVLAKAWNVPYVASAVRYYEIADYIVYLLIILLLSAGIYKSVKKNKPSKRKETAL